MNYREFHEHIITRQVFLNRCLNNLMFYLSIKVSINSNPSLRDLPDFLGLPPTNFRSIHLLARVKSDWAGV